MSIFIQVYTKKYINLKLGTKQNYENNIGDWNNINSLLLKPLRERLIDLTFFSISKQLFFLDPFCSNSLITVVLFFQIFLILEFTKPNSRNTPAFFFFHFLFLVLIYLFLRRSNYSFVCDRSYVITLPVSC